MISHLLKQGFKLKWLSFKKKLFAILPFPASVKKTKQQKYKLQNIALKSELQKNTVTSLFGKYATGILFDSYNGLLVSGLQDVQVNTQLGFNGAYNKKEVEVLLPLISSESCVYVVGTHIGSLLVPVAKKAARVIAVEANPATYEFLKMNMYLNDLSGKVSHYNYAVYDKETVLDFYQNKANTGGSKIVPSNDDFRYTYDNPEVVKVTAKPLDTLQKQNGFPLPDIIIMDIEGSEYFALKGATDCLKYASCLYVEFAPDHLKNVAGISVDMFIEAILPYFNTMQIMAEMMNGENRIYKDESIALKLTSMNAANTSADLLFLNKNY